MKKKEVELRNGPAHGKRVMVPVSVSGVTVPFWSVVDAEGVASVTYRPTDLKCADGTEIWVPQTPSTH